MKKIFVLTAALVAGLCMTTDGYAQSEMTAVQLAGGNNSSGSARYQALSGAMGAVGVDFSSINQNPAGIGLFRSNGRVSFTGGFNSYQGESNWGSGINKLKSSDFRFEELSYMASSRTQGGGNITWGFGIQNAGRFKRRLDAMGTHSGPQGFSLADYTAALLNRTDYMPSDLKKDFTSDAPWLGTIGYLSKWIEYAPADNAYQSAYAFDGLNEGPRSAGLQMSESGAITNFDLAISYAPSAELSFGMSLTTVSLDYSYVSSYSEGFRPVNASNPTGEYYGLSLDNAYDVNGVGLRLGFGVIFQPTDNLRLGASLYTPTFSTYTIQILGPMYNTGLSPLDPSKAYLTETPVGDEFDFNLHTPLRLGLSGAYIFGRTAILSADYEYSDLGKTRLKKSSSDDYYYAGNPYAGDNTAIDEDFGPQHTLRVGLEVNATRRLALRGGYRLTTAPKMSDEINANIPTREVYVAGTAVHYRLPGDKHSFSLGLGYRLSPNWTLDVAYVNAWQEDKTYAFPAIRDKVANLSVRPTMGAISDKYSSQKLLATISYRF